LKFLIEKGEDRAMNDAETELSTQIDSFKQKFIDAMDDDLNTADAISVLLIK
jgi:cysteinyl-tRNA synthetase